MNHFFMRMRRTYRFWFLFAAISVSSVSEGAGSGGYSNSNRDLYAFPQSAAMARADAIYAIDASPFVNPGAMAMESGNALSATYAGFYANTFSTSAVSYRTAVSQSMGVGVSMAYLLVPRIPITSNWRTNAVGYPVSDSALTRFANASEVFVRAAWGMRAASWQWGALYAGAAINALRRNLVGVYGHGIGADAGVIVHVPRFGVGLGVNAENITGSYLDWSRSSYYDLAYPHIRLAIGFQKDFPYMYGRIQASYASLDFLSNEGMNAQTSDTAHSTEVPRKIHPSQDPVAFILNGRLGAEYLLWERVALRIGTSMTNRLAFGAGVYFLKRTVAVDFAYLLHELAGTYQVGLGYRW